MYISPCLCLSAGSSIPALEAKRRDLREDKEKFNTLITKLHTCITQAKAKHEGALRDLTHRTSELKLREQERARLQVSLPIMRVFVSFRFFSSL